MMIGKEALIRLARTLPKGHEVVKEKLLQWMEETRVREESGAPSIDYIVVAIEHTIMKFKLGFISKEEALDELRESGEALASDPGGTNERKEKLSNLIDSIENDSFEIL